MAKSEGNFMTLENAFVQNGIDPLAYRYAAFLTHYRKPMEYSPEAMEGAVNGVRHLRNQVRTLKDAADGKQGQIGDDLRVQFLKEINDDLNMPRAMAVVQELLKSDRAPEDKLATVFDFDRVLGLDLAQVDKADTLPAAIEQMVAERIKAREARDFARSDELRDAIEAQGYAVQDTPEGMKVFKP